MIEKRRVLIVTTVASTIDQFCMNDIDILYKMYCVEVAANFTLGNNTSIERTKVFKKELTENNIVVNEINFNRNPFSLSNIFAYIKTKKLIKDNMYELIHCHTPVAAMLTRLAAKKTRKKGTKIIYTAHGFHFYKGAPLINWMVYYPLERWLARYTDVLITINKEDFTRAEKSFRAGKVVYVPGVGIDNKKYINTIVNKASKRQEIGVPSNAFVILSVGELNKNKNHETIIRTIAKLNNPNVFYVICGQGALEDYLKALIEQIGLENQVVLLGFRKDIAEICKVSDVFAFPSYREGLSVSLMESMACGLPVICSNIRGNIDLIDDSKGGYLIKPDDVKGFQTSIEKLLSNVDLRELFSAYNIKSVNKYDINNIKNEMKKIYKITYNLSEHLND